MKSRIIIAALFAATFLLLTGCGAARKAKTTPVSTFVMPGNEYLSGGGVIRALGIGRSDNESVARKKAMAEASAELAAALQRVVTSTVDNYVTDLSEGMSSDSKTLFTSKTTVSVNQALKGAIIVYDRWNKDEQTGMFTNYIVMALNGEDYLNILYEELGKEAQSVDKDELNEYFLKFIEAEGKKK